MTFEQQLLPLFEGRRNAVVEAGAGTGKTTRIVKDVVMLLLRNPDVKPERIVLVTFTEKAAAEIAERVRWALTDLHLHFDDERVTWPSGSTQPVIEIDERDRERFRAACEIQMHRIDRLRSQTIHSFCQQIVRLYPVEAGIDPRFRIVQGFELSTLIAETYDQWLARETMSGDEAILREWEILTDELEMLDRVREAITTLRGRREIIDDASLSLGEVGPADLELRAAIFPFTELAPGEFARCCPEAVLCIEHLQRTPLPSQPDLEAWIAVLDPINDVLRDLDLNDFPASVRPAVKFLRGEEGRANRRTACDKLLSHRAAVALRSATSRFAQALDEEKNIRGMVDFDDLLFLTARLLENETILSSVRERFDYIFVDEFQDTDRLQAKIIDLLARDRSGAVVPGRTSIVGDPKQSIYSFRRADPETFARVVKQFINEGARHEFLDAQYRSTPALVESINAMFAALFPEGAVTDGAVLRPSYKSLRAAREKGDDPPPLRFLGATLPEGEDSDRIEAEMVAEWIDRHRNREGSDLRRFAILMRKMTNSWVYADVFERRGIPLILPPARTLFDRRACVDLMAVLRAIAYPFDEAAVFSAARSPYFGLTDDEIVASRVEGMDGSAFRAVKDALRSYGMRAADSTVAELIDTVVETSRVRELYTLLRTGSRSLSHLERFRDLAVEYDLSVGGSLRQFVDELTRRRAEADDAEPVVTDESENGVRMMTVHAAKGLEFETVIMPDLSGLTRSDNVRAYATDDPPRLVISGSITSLSRHFDRAGQLSMKDVESGRERAELDRLFYVAVTRAKREVVFVTAFEKKPSKAGFWKPLADALALDLEDLPSLFPDEGETVERELTTAGATLRIPFQRMSVPQKSTGSIARFRSEALAAAVESINTAVVVTMPEETRLPRPEILRAVAAARRRGTGIALHRFLELWSLRDEEREETLSLVDRELALSGGESRELRKLAGAIASSEALQTLRGSEIVARELPIFYADEEGRPRSGRLDLLVRTKGRLTVVDYKSGGAYDERVEKDSAQVRSYCRAVERMSGESCDGLLWYIGEEQRLVVVERTNGTDGTDATDGTDGTYGTDQGRG